MNIKIFSYKDQQHVIVNGKQFFLIDSFKRRRNSEPFFLRVVGAVPLDKEDLGAGYQVVPTRDKGRVVSTAYLGKFFAYEAARDQEVAFVGISTLGSVSLALKFLIEQAKMVIEAPKLFQAARQLAEDPRRLSLAVSFILIGNEGSNKESQAVVLRIERPKDLPNILASLF